MAVILIADDNKQITSVLADYAKKDGYEVLVAYDGEQAINLFNKGNIDLILLDVMMPIKDGFEVCREIRKTSTTPVIMITARGEDFERIMGLDIGADDYIVKPFSPAEVMARVRAIMRRITPNNKINQENQILKINDLYIDLDKFLVKINNETIPLTKKEMELLWTMAYNPNRVYSRDQLLDLIWGYDYYGDLRTVDSHIKRLRAKLDLFNHPNWEIETIWGVGYKFEVKDNEK
ncbi:DNA-binding response OmpR family regulator [Bacilli bacterium PM5-3]|nr:DNA-binding response OmpR family regulator [Bacilli bacterium PM5-3]MDH6603929.1 DNA-binding response OmpR family regulator [Bacilli bacterium PM5-9]